MRREQAGPLDVATRRSRSRRREVNDMASWLSRASAPLAIAAGVAPVFAAGTAPLAPQRLAFEANRGQIDAQVRFVARGAAYTAFFTSTEAVLTLADRRTVLRLKPTRADGARRVVGNGALPGVVNYVRGDSLDTRITAPTYRRVRYVGVYPGIDLVYYGGPSGLEYDLIVAPGA